MRAPGGTVAFDPTGRSPGRGAYTCRDESCVDRGLRRGGLARNLRATIGPDDAARLRDAAVEYLRVVRA